MSTTPFITSIRDLIAQNKLNAALLQIRTLLEHSPKLDEAIHHSARFHAIRQQIRLGVVSHAEATLTENQIRGALLDLLSEIEESIKESSSHNNSAALRTEMEKATSIINSKNVVIGSTISGENITIGDQTIHTESETSRRLRLLLFVLVPILAIAGAFFWYQYEKMQTPLALTVTVDNRTPNPELPFEGGTLRLQYGDKTDTQSIQTEANFKGIPANFRGEELALHFEANGFVTIDTSFELSSSVLTLPIRRDNSLGRVFGTVKDGNGNPLVGVAIRVQDLNTISSSNGTFELPIPFEKQRKQQRVTVSLNGYKPWDYTFPVSAKEEISIILQK